MSNCIRNEVIVEISSTKYAQNVEYFSSQNQNWKWNYKAVWYVPIPADMISCGDSGLTENIIYWETQCHAVYFHSDTDQLRIFNATRIFDVARQFTIHLLNLDQSHNLCAFNTFFAFSLYLSIFLYVCVCVSLTIYFIWTWIYQSVFSCHWLFIYFIPFCDHFHWITFPLSNVQISCWFNVAHAYGVLILMLADCNSSTACFHMPAT